MSRPLRIKQNEYPYHVTTKINNSNFLLGNHRWIFSIFALVLNAAIKKYHIRIMHIVIMGNHYHMVIQTKCKNIDRVMQFINSLLARLINKKLKRTGHLWGERYYSTIVGGKTYRENLIRYVYMNPVRAGIVDDPGDYHCSSFLFYAFGKEIEVLISEDEIYFTFGKDEQKRRKHFYLHIVEELTEEEVSTIKAKLKKSFYGSDDFINRMQQKYKDQQRCA